MLLRRRSAVRRACGLSPLYVFEHDPAEADAPLVVLIHGTMDRSASFARAARRLPEMRVITYDRRGYGRSAALGPATGIATHVGDLTAILAGAPATVIGHSFGGDVALAFAVEHPELTIAVAAFEPPMPWLPWWPEGGASRDIQARGVHDPEEVAEQFFRLVAGDDAWDSLPEQTKADRRREGPAVLSDIAALTDGPPPFSVEALAGLPMPVFLGTGECSKAHQREGTARLASEIGVPVEVIGGAHHGAHRSHPGDFAEWVRHIVG